MKREREAAGMTQRRLTAALGRSSSFVWKFEAGERQLDVLEFIELSRLLGCDPARLIEEVERDQ